MMTTNAKSVLYGVQAVFREQKRAEDVGTIEAGPPFGMPAR
jgi:hypothetical protein